MTRRSDVIGFASLYLLVTVPVVVLVLQFYSIYRDFQMQTLWVVSKMHTYRTPDWTFQGVYDSEEKAIQACLTEDYFIGPVGLNEPIPHERMAWPGAYFPLLENKQGRENVSRDETQNRH